MCVSSKSCFQCLLVLYFILSDVVTAHEHDRHRHTQRCMVNDPTAVDAAHLNAKIQSFQQQRSYDFTSEQSIVVQTYFIM